MFGVGHGLKGGKKGKSLPTGTQVVWTSLVNTTATGSSLQKTSGGNAWNANGKSTKQIQSGDGYIEVTVGDSTSQWIIGLSNTSGAGPAEVQFGAYIIATAPGYFSVQEGSNQINIGGDVGGGLYFSGLAVGDTIRVAKVGTQIKYSHNGVVKWTSAATPTLPLYGDAEFYESGGQFTNAVMLGAT